MDFEIPWALRDIELPSSRKEHLIIEHTVSFVLRNGDQSEVRLRLDASASRRVPFINVNHHLHPYYQWLKSTKASLEDRAPHLLPEGWSFWRSRTKKNEHEKTTANRSCSPEKQKASTDSLSGLLGHYVEDDLSPLSLKEKAEKDRQEKSKESQRAKRQGFDGHTASSSSSSVPKKSRSGEHGSCLQGLLGYHDEGEGKKKQSPHGGGGLGGLLGYNDDGNDSNSEDDHGSCLPGTIIPSPDRGKRSGIGNKTSSPVKDQCSRAHTSPEKVSVSVQADIPSPSFAVTGMQSTPNGGDKTPTNTTMNLNALATSAYAQLQEAQRKYAEAYHALQKKNGAPSAAGSDGHVPHALRKEGGSTQGEVNSSNSAIDWKEAAAASPYVTLRQHREKYNITPMLPGIPVVMPTPLNPANSPGGSNPANSGGSNNRTVNSANSGGSNPANSGASNPANSGGSNNARTTPNPANSGGSKNRTVNARASVTPDQFPSPSSASAAIKTAHSNNTVGMPVKGSSSTSNTSSVSATRPQVVVEGTGKNQDGVMEADEPKKEAPKKEAPKKEAPKTESDALFTSLLEYAETIDLTDDKTSDEKPKNDKEDKKDEKKTADAPSNALSALFAYDDEPSEEETPFWPEPEKKLEKNSIALIQDVGIALLKQDINTVRCCKKVSWPEFAFLKGSEGAYFKEIVDACIKKIEAGEHKSVQQNANPNKKVVAFMCKLMMEQQNKCAKASIKRAGKITTPSQEKQDKMEERRQRALKLLQDKKK